MMDVVAVETRAPYRSAIDRRFSQTDGQLVRQMLGASHLLIRTSLLDAQPSRFRPVNTILIAGQEQHLDPQTKRISGRLL